MLQLSSADYSISSVTYICWGHETRGFWGLAHGHISYFLWYEVKFCLNSRKIGYCKSTSGDTERIVAREDRFLIPFSPRKNFSSQWWKGSNRISLMPMDLKWCHMNDFLFSSAIGILGGLTHINCGEKLMLSNLYSLLLSYPGLLVCLPPK